MCCVEKFDHLSLRHAQFLQETAKLHLVQDKIAILNKVKAGLRGPCQRSVGDRPRTSGLICCRLMTC